MWFARFQILICEPQSTRRKLLVLSWLYFWPPPNHCAATKTLRFQLIFQVGLHPSKNSINRKVIQETNDYGDVLLQDFYEHYTNLSVKSVMILKYFRENLKIKPDFLFKVKIKELFITYLNTVISVGLWNFKDGGSLKANFLAKNQHTTKEKSLRKSYK